MVLQYYQQALVYVLVLVILIQLLQCLVLLLAHMMVIHLKVVINAVDTDIAVRLGSGTALGDALIVGAGDTFEITVQTGVQINVTAGIVGV